MLPLQTAEFGSSDPCGFNMVVTAYVPYSPAVLGGSLFQDHFLQSQSVTYRSAITVLEMSLKKKMKHKFLKV